MNTGLTHFKKGNTAAIGKKGKKHISTLFKKNLKDSIKELDEKLFELTCEFLTSRDLHIRFLAWKELFRYRIPKMMPEKDESKEWLVTVRNFCDERVDELDKL